MRCQGIWFPSGPCRDEAVWKCWTELEDGEDAGVFDHQQEGNRYFMLQCDACKVAQEQEYSGWDEVEAL